MALGKDLGRIWKGFWEDFGRILGGFWKDFGCWICDAILDGFWKGFEGSWMGFETQNENIFLLRKAGLGPAGSMRG